MSAKKPLNVGVVGYGFMGRTHANAFRQVGHFFDLGHQPVLKAVCARDEGKVRAFAAEAGYESYETAWRTLVARPDIDLIDIAAPNDAHAAIAVAAGYAANRGGRTALTRRSVVCADSTVATSSSNGVSKSSSVRAWG